MQRESLGFLLERAAVLKIPLASLLSRTPAAPPDARHGNDDWGESHDSGIWVVGRIVMNVWRIMRSELKLGIYSMENVVHNVLKVRVPHYHQATLTQWWAAAPAAAPARAPAAGSTGRAPAPPRGGGASSSSSSAALAARVPPSRWRVVDHCLARAALSLHLLDELDIGVFSSNVRQRCVLLTHPILTCCTRLPVPLSRAVGRTSEMARLFGIDFFSVLSRGSQYRVEAVMLRVSRPFDFVAPAGAWTVACVRIAAGAPPLCASRSVCCACCCVAASRTQVARQAAMEVQPLILEPHSRVFPSPVVVFDFQSLYPSVVIAYNMCYSTILGRLSPSTAAMNPKVGFMQYAAPQGALQQSYQGYWDGTAIRREEPGPEVAVRDTGRRVHRPASAYISPNGVVFAPWSKRRGILPRMLQEILDTRVMVKAAMKGCKTAADTRMMHARQFALKMIANVTYGYTAAGECKAPMAR